MFRKMLHSDVKWVTALANSVEGIASSDDLIIPEKFFREKIESKNKLSLIIQLSGKDAGFCLVTLNDPSKNCACLCDMALKEEFQGKGIAKNFVNQLFRELKKHHNIRYVYLYTDTRNKRATKFYEKLGFKRGHTFLWMEKNI